MSGGKIKHIIYNIIYSKLCSYWNKFIPPTMQKAIRLLCWLIVILVIGACFIYYVEGTDNQSKTSLFLLAVAVNLYCTSTWEWILAVFRLISIDDDESKFTFYFIVTWDLLNKFSTKTSSNSCPLAINYNPFFKSPAQCKLEEEIRSLQAENALLRVSKINRTEKNIISLLQVVILVWP